MKRLAAVGFLGVLLSCGPVGSSHEHCSNGLDDDGNGQTDCQDAACAGVAGCCVGSGCNTGQDGGYFGSCQKCGQSCTKQQECLSVGYHGDDPLPQCVAGRCQALLEGIDVRFEVDTQAWTGLTYVVRSMTTRFILKTAVNGSPVSCATVQAGAQGTAASDADQLERSGAFNLLSFDVAPVQAQVGTVFTQPLLPTGTGAGFLIWVELWSGSRASSAPYLPTGSRLGWGCFESGPAVEPILTQHHWPTKDGTQTSRTIRVLMPAPQ